MMSPPDKQQTMKEFPGDDEKERSTMNAKHCLFSPSRCHHPSRVTVNFYVVFLILVCLPLLAVGLQEGTGNDMTAQRQYNSTSTTSTYIPRHISSELCHSLGETDCRHADASMAIQHGHYNKEQRRRQLEPNLSYDTNVLVLLMQFTDHTDRSVPPPYEYQLLLNLRVSKYLELNSYGAVNVWFDVIPWHVTDNTELHYSFEQSGRNIELQNAFHPLLNELYDTQQMDFSPYDKNGDGVIDNLLIIHSGYPAEVGGIDCKNSRPVHQRIWSHALADVSKYNWVSSDGAMRTNAYTFAAGLHDVCGSAPCKTGVVTHEFFHAFSDIPDLYDTSLNDEGALKLQGRGGVGSLDIMANPYGVNGDDEDFPSHLSPWTKIQMGWMAPTNANAQVDPATGKGTFTLRPSELYPDVLKITMENFMGREYFLLENRQRKFFDVKLFGTGVAIYHVDESSDGQNNRGFPGQSQWPTNGNHYKVAVVQKDGQYHLEHAENRGDANDFFNVGDTLGPNDADGRTWPNTDTYGLWSSVFPTGIVIEVTGKNGLDMEVTVTIPNELQGAAAPMKEQEPLPEVDNTDVLSGKYEAAWFLEDRNVGRDDEEQQGNDEAAGGDVGVGFVERPPERDEETTDAQSTGDSDGSDTATTDGTADGEPPGVLFSSNQKEPGADANEMQEEEDEDFVDAVPSKETSTSSNATEGISVGTSNATAEAVTANTATSDGTSGETNDAAGTTTSSLEDDMEELFPNLFVNSTAKEEDGADDEGGTAAPTATINASREPTSSPSHEPTVDGTHVDEVEILPIIDVLSPFTSAACCFGSSTLLRAGTILLVAFLWLG
ncbi:Immune inhibitor A peptidase M6 [Seminavis robusta]|uniref:Immune inhibitor A peptidase M6 n=1 Tax=Seminavis robusta TaxID=568900 RepID=A0A9N8E6T0_9STRA|nr:Immune inhibitor A peptidase M6 [Seminavis robusta]|eukprot:Sro735_g194950.1 Immune inhibitor A peptidase M6 (831) ;mRNA; f:44119-46727